MNITLIGAGMGSPRTLTREAEETLLAADAIIGAPRLLAALPDGILAEKFAEALPEKIASLVAARPRWRSAAVVLSGDPGFYSGAKKLLALLRDHDVAVLPGISAPQYFAARLRRPWQDFRLVSAHGVACDVLAEALNHPAVFFLTDGETTPRVIAQTLCDAGLCDARLSVGENLSASDERIATGTAEELRGADFAQPAVVLVENDRTFARAPGSAGIPDDEFIRGGVPMTKREVRAVALSLLALRPADICCDIGAGTGSVAVEMAFAARRGRVHAVDSSAAACDLLRRNREKFGAYNMIPMQGEAPEALAALPPSDAVFIGGSKGALPEIIRAVLGKNPRARLVVSAIALETLAAATETLRGLFVPNLEVTQIAASRAAVRGGCHMLAAQNPVFLISGGGA